MKRGGKKVLIVSPHPDDASFSLGGALLKNQLHDVLVWNVFSKKSFNILNMDQSEAHATILCEEEMAAEKTGVRITFSHFEDAKERGYRRMSDIFGSPFDLGALIQREHSLFARIQQRFESLIAKQRPHWVGLPLGSGFHIDHALAREAALSSPCLSGADGPRVFFYEDLPYSTNPNWLTAALKDCKAKAKIRERKILIDEFIQKKKELVLIYKSQAKPRDARAIIDYAMSIPGGAFERIWIKYV